MSEQYFSCRAESSWRPRQLDGAAFAKEGFRVGEEADHYVHFRLTIEGPGTVTSANCLASVDVRYCLHVNGVLVGRGPGRCSPLLQPLDDYDLARYRKPGRNVIAVRAPAYGRHTPRYEMPGWEQLPHGTFNLNTRAASIDTTLHAPLTDAQVDHVRPTR